MMLFIQPVQSHDYAGSSNEPGNITSLTRNGLQDGGTYSLIDNLTLSYDGNQLTEVSETANDYGFTPYYYNKDHLGNNREVVNSSSNVQQLTNYYPFGAPYADPVAVIGSTIQPYKYNGKELDTMHGLNTYDYGARQYYSIIGRWDRMDPLCEKYYSTSPYVYCLNNPIGNIDPDGRSVWTKLIKTGIKVGTRVSRNGWKELGKAANYADAVSDITDNVRTLFDSNASTTERVGAGVSLASELLPVSLGDFKDAKKLVSPKNSRTARREVMRKQGIPTSQQPISQSKNASGREYSYETFNEEGKSVVKSVQQQTRDISHPNEKHWEAGEVKTDEYGNIEKNRYERPKLKNGKDKEYYE